MQTLLKSGLAITLLVVFGSAAIADGGSGGTTQLKQFRNLIEAQKYEQAIDEIGKALVKTPEDADLLNLVAYSHRKLEYFDIALDYYLRALKIEPKHRGANEYLGELYLQMGQPEKAGERLKVLDDACFFGCEEYDELKAAIEAYQGLKPE